MCHGQNRTLESKRADEASGRRPAPSVDVVVSAVNEERHIRRCLNAILEQDYPRDLVRVRFVDGGSVDGTVAIARDIAANDPRLEVLDGLGHLNLPQALNLAITRGVSCLVAKVDAHGYPDPDFLDRAVEAFADAPPDVAVVGGKPIQQGETTWGQAVARARTSRFGTGGSVYATSLARAYVDTVQCGVYQRAALDRAGLFDPTMNFGEDDELNWRLREMGYRVYLDTAIRFHYVTRSTARGLFRQYHNYGAVKVCVAAAHPQYLRPWHLAPVALVVGGAAVGGASIVSKRARIVGATCASIYALAGVAAAYATPGSRRAVDIARVVVCFAAMHIAYGTGMIRGLRRLRF